MDTLFKCHFAIIILWLTGCAAIIPHQQTGVTTLFVGKNHATGMQLWKTDGTRSGTRILTYLNNDTPASSEISNLVSLGNVAVFSAYHPKYGREMWRTDGTDAGTRLLMDTLPGPASGIGEDSYGNVDEARTSKGLFFWSTNDKQLILWVTNGTRPGTKRLHTFPIPEYASKPTLVSSQERILFWVNDGKHGLEPWVSDGTASGTKMLADTSNELTPKADDYSYAPGFLQTPQATWFISPDARHDQSTFKTGHSLWRTQGTPASTQRLGQLAADASYSPVLLEIMGDSLFYNAQSEPNGPQTRLLKMDLRSGQKEIIHDFQDKSGIGSFSSPLVSGNKLYFWYRTTDQYANVAELWQTDGSNNGTHRLLRVPFGEYENYAPPFEFAGQIYFFGVTDTKNPYRASNTHNPTAALWRTDGSAAGARPVAIPHIPGSHEQIMPFVLLNNKLLFVTSKNWPETQQPNRLEIIDATQPDKTITLGEFDSIILFAKQGQNFGNEALLFVVGDQLWQTDGTPAGTRKLGNFGLPHKSGGPYPSSASYWAGSLPVRLDNGKQLLTYADQTYPPGHGLWVINEKTGKLEALANLNPMPGSSNISDLTRAGQSWYFIKDLKELWYSDGTSRGTVPVQGPGKNQLPVSSYGNSATHHDQYYFLTRNEAEKNLTLWVAQNGQAIPMKSWPKSPSEYSTGRYLYAGENLYLLDETQGKIWRLFRSKGTNLENTPLLQGDDSGKIRFTSLTELDEGFLYTLESPNPVIGDVATTTQALWYYDNASKQSTLIRQNVGSVHKFVDKAYTLYTGDSSKTFDLLEFDPVRKRLIPIGHFDSGNATTTTSINTQAAANGFFILIGNPTKGDHLWFMDTTKQPVRPQLAKQFDKAFAVEFARLNDGNQLLYLNVHKRNDPDIHGDASTLWITDGSASGTRELKAGLEIPRY